MEGAVIGGVGGSFCRVTDGGWTKSTSIMAANPPDSRSERNRGQGQIASLLSEFIGKHHLHIMGQTIKFTSALPGGHKLGIGFLGLLDSFCF